MNQTTIEAVDHSDGSARVVEMTVRQQLDVFVESIDTHLHDLRMSLARAEDAAEVKRAICAALPASLPLVPTSLSADGQAYKANAGLVFDVTSRDQVLALVEALPGEDVVMVQGGCTTFVPEDRFVVDDRGTTMTPVGEVVYRLSTYCGKLQEEYTWWTRLANKLVQVRAKLTGTLVPVKVYTRSVEIAPHTVQLTWDYSGLPLGNLLQFYGGGRSNVAPISVHQRRGASFKDALAGAQVTTAKATKDSCAC